MDCARVNRGQLGGRFVWGGPLTQKVFDRDRQPNPRHDAARRCLHGAPLIEFDLIVMRQGSDRKPRPYLCAIQGWDDDRRTIDLARIVLVTVEAIHDPGAANVGRYFLWIGDGFFVGQGGFYP